MAVELTPSPPPTHNCQVTFLAILLRECVWVFSFQEWTCPSFPFGELGTFAVFELPTVLTCFAKIC